VWYCRIHWKEKNTYDILSCLEKSECQGYDFTGIDYHTASLKECDINKQKNLAKSVIVE